MDLNKNTDYILNRASLGGRINKQQALSLFKEVDLNKLGMAADTIRKRFHPGGRVTFIIDRNINYTNVCINRCGFCAFYRNIDSPDAYLFAIPYIMRKVKDAISCGATQIMLQGGLHPDIKIDYFTNLFKSIKETFDVTIHSLSPPEIIHVADNSGLSIKDTLQKLKESGLDSLPGGGAEILSDKTRKRISPKKISSSQWLSVMKTAHTVGIYSTATMMFGIGEDIDERVDHLNKIRELQDKTNMFRAFIPWTFQPGNTDIGGHEASAADYLKTLAISRIFLDNINNIQGSWLTQGEEVGQISLFFGANDLGSIMLEENVVRSTGVHNTMDVEHIVRLIDKSGYLPVQRNTEYSTIKEYSKLRSWSVNC